jgi:hypothetical protein
MPKEYPIDLGKKSDHSMMAMPKESEDDSKVHYPSLYISGVKVSLPDSGEITLKFKKLSETKSTREGKTDYSVELEIQEICDVESKEEEKKEDSGEALDRLAEEADDEEDD